MYMYKLTQELQNTNSFKMLMVHIPKLNIVWAIGEVSIITSQIFICHFHFQIFFFNFIFIVDTIIDVTISPPLPASTRPLPASLWPSPHWCLCLCLWVICSLTKPFTFFYPVPLLPSSPTAVNLFYVSMPLFLFCS